ncbi:MAG: hypothetical protein MJ218_02985 [Opitutales bacterium]|nr:hypothetical protein [Opitutales bacterium]
MGHRIRPIVRNQNKLNHQGSLVLALMIVMALGSIIPLAALVSTHQYRRFHDQQRSQLARLQVKETAHEVWDRLRQWGTDPALALACKDGQWRFYDTQKEAIRELGTLDDEFTNGFVVVKPLLSPTPIPLSCFQSDGLRPSLTEAIQKGFPCFTNQQQALMSQKWLALTTEDVLPADLFLPILSECYLTDFSLWNPYDRPIKGLVSATLAFNIGVDADGVIYPDGTENVALPIELAAGASIMEDVMDNRQLLRVELRDAYHNCFGLESLLYLLTYDDRSDLFYQYEPFGEAMSIHDTIAHPTKNWVQRLNACCFFDPKRPYAKIGHAEECELNAFVWNETVANPDALPFFINGDSEQLYQQLQRLLGEQVSADGLQAAVGELIAHQPYPNGYAFIQQVSALQALKPFLHVFEALTARCELFQIESVKTVGDRRYSYTLVVQRDPVSLKWSIVSKNFCERPRDAKD